MLAITSKKKYRYNKMAKRILTVNRRNPTIRIPAQFLNSIELDKRKTKIKLSMDVNGTGEYPILIIGKIK
jgi:hypothetical protein